jgi:hypothetical protein
MTRKSKREIERALEDFNRAGADGVDVVWRDDVTGEIVDRDGEPTEPDPDAETVIVINDTVVMPRERAEEQGREILGPAEVPREDIDAVRVASDS